MVIRKGASHSGSNRKSNSRKETRVSKGKLREQLGASTLALKNEEQENEDIVQYVEEKKAEKEAKMEVAMNGNFDMKSRINAIDSIVNPDNLVKIALDADTEQNGVKPTDPEYMTHRIAIEKLVELRNDNPHVDHVKYFKEIIDESPYPEVRVYALSKIREPLTKEEREARSDMSEKEVQEYHKEFRNYIIDLATSDKHESVREETLNFMKFNPEYDEVLMQISKRDSDKDIREKAHAFLIADDLAEEDEEEERAQERKRQKEEAMRQQAQVQQQKQSKPKKKKGLRDLL